MQTRSLLFLYPKEGRKRKGRIAEKRCALCLFFGLLRVSRLLTQAEFFDDGTVAVDVAVVQIVEQSATLTYQHSQSSFSAIILSVELQVLSQVRNTV